MLLVFAHKKLELETLNNSQLVYRLERLKKFEVLVATQHLNHLVKLTPKHNAMSLSRKYDTKNPKLTIASTRFHSHQCPQLQNAKHNWIRRNNSSNVSSILGSLTDSDSEEEQPRRLIYSKTPTPELLKTFCTSCYCKTRPVTPVTPCGCNKHEIVPCKCKKSESCGSKKRGNCPCGYKKIEVSKTPHVCKKLEISPRVFKKTENSPRVCKKTEISPRVCKKPEDSPRVYKKTEISPCLCKKTENSPRVYKKPETSPCGCKKTEISHSKNTEFPVCCSRKNEFFTCGCKKTDDPFYGSKKSEAVSTRCSEVDDWFGTARRKVRSLKSQKLESNYCPKSQNLCSSVCTKITSHPCKFTPSRRNYENLTSNYFVKEECGGKTISRELLDFREGNFFECHKTTVSTPQPHKCKHIFALDKNLNAKPQNPDVYGVSRCSTCSRPISANSSQFLPPKSNSEISKTTSVTSEDRVSVSVSTDEEDLVFHVDKEVVEQNVLPKKIVRRGARPMNSVALRFQKGIY